MPRSRIVRMSLFVLMLGVGVWGVLVLPSFSQDPDGVAPPATLGTGNRSATGLGLPGATPAGGLPPGALTVPASVGSPAEFNPLSEGSDDGFGNDISQAPGTPSQGLSGIAGPPGAGAPPGVAGPGPGFAPMGMMGGGGMSGMAPGGLTQSQIEEIKLARHAKALLSRYSQEQKPENKEKIKSELRSVLHRQFRLQHQRRDAELTRIEKRLADLRSRLKKRGDAQSTIVDRRLEQLVNDVDGLGWSADEIPDNLFNEGGMGSMMMPGMPGMGMMPAGGATGAPGVLGGAIGGGGFGTVSEADTGGGSDVLDPNALPSPPNGATTAPGSLEGSGTSNESPETPNPLGATPPAPPGADAVPATPGNQ